MIILGIDPGIAILGYGIVKYEGNKFKVIDYGAIKTSSKMATPQRLKEIYLRLDELISEYQPDAVAIEELFFNTNTTTAMVVSHARGVAVLAAAIHEKEIYEYTPLQVKQAVVGYGRAEKKQVQQMIKILLNLEQAPKPDDVADALAVAVCHAHSGHFQSLFKVK
ncbi:crossover junction endodeoxyribonuclease RuvC [Alkaliphilus metalliredigens QYMF]|uniref:Crossover junction endodeoxyribonuclease RuvC n=1 Tax=Alkaliphilus metalliredigens (strain QYMF) TaxID=293826 RepID=RUVC_ALKMQ|nr:crossover junction endodeoxyribonuclease RuvC [Alkaliphilus metalliredigens]A6TQM3.1 RecName: Full=Crossover junction endodeoxyribonuclease RuvC; AltName: Full=Holliday junction nuclease RuvC; AltName: Full=Holliday junction resolvase RuvC [Alkaliphilus metalliredigens QYMF]ABR48491.1 crossover junction endodeoxyribonuclease RuvC [Alkaliphilus metalliredigens QYMF]